jgi:TatD DNase family protein
VSSLVTFKNSVDSHRVVSRVPMDRILVETDAPFLAPVPFRADTCHSGHVLWTLAKLADIKVFDDAVDVTLTHVVVVVVVAGCYI